MPQTPWEAREASKIEAAGGQRELRAEELAEYKRLARVSHLRAIEERAERDRLTDRLLGMPFDRAMAQMTVHQ